MTQDTGQRWKTSNQVQQGKNRQNHMFTRLPSSPARHGELTKEKIGREACLLATNAPWRVTYSPRRVKSLGRRARAVLPPQDDVAQTHWGRKLCSPWQARRTREAS